ncbi:MAG: hypothetical protein WCF06_14535 [Nitrososphaeraceae archaeon]
MISVIKRLFGEQITSRLVRTQNRELSFRCIAYNMRRLTNLVIIVMVSTWPINRNQSTSTRYIKDWEEDVVKKLDLVFQCYIWNHSQDNNLRTIYDIFATLKNHSEEITRTLVIEGIVAKISNILDSQMTTLEYTNTVLRKYL